MDSRGEVRMVDISRKASTERRATASASVRMSEAAFDALDAASNKKGDVLAAVRLAGIGAAKKTADLIPLCHQVTLSSCQVEIAEPTREPEGGGYRVELRATTAAKDATGVEMEALTAVSVAALTLYDMLKAVDRGLTIERIQLLSKEGGQRGPYRHDPLTDTE